MAFVPCPFRELPASSSRVLSEVFGIFDVKDGEECDRLPCQPYVDKLRRWQRMLDHPEDLEADALRRGGRGTVQLSEVRECARRWEEGAPARRLRQSAGDFSG